ncbi:hypothetical protein [Brevundimonas diminuta]|uniref:Uncharacterized protein n=1 Tax=Brevundimonas diminuta TaxID=293 RepID=A0A410NTD0_BREDI|nr:hypothetical protein [Brevundimonas diminuta]QAT13021.1 hypothetical protein EQG53_00865 [Brevundimonas diminuta]QQB89633.1 hypothetical protein I6H83_04100 [Brevundimonas diminuta]GEC01804.1 hypothetical protein BDI01nite_28680 [Brevundimonas diminuta]
MTDAERIEALLDLVDPDRTANPDALQRLAVLGLAEPTRKGFQPTSAGWVVMGDRGRPFDT